MALRIRIERDDGTIQGVMLRAGELLSQAGVCGGKTLVPFRDIGAAVIEVRRTQNRVAPAVATQLQARLVRFRGAARDSRHRDRSRFKL